MRKSFTPWSVCVTSPPRKPGFGVYCKQVPGGKIWIEFEGLTEVEAAQNALMLNTKQIQPKCFKEAKEEQIKLKKEKAKRN